MGILAHLRRKDSAVRVSFEFDDGPVFNGSPIERLARASEAMASSSPFTAVEYPFFEATKAADWFSSGAIIDSGWSSYPNRRLRAIKYGADTLLENTFTADGHLSAIHYSDGEAVFYEWNDRNREKRLKWKSGREMVVRLRPDNLPQSIIYGKDRFDYEYDAAGNVVQVVYPDSVTVRRRFGVRGELTSVACGQMNASFRWNGANEILGYKIEANGRQLELRAAAARGECDLPSSSSSPSAVNLLGVWHMKNVLHEMLTPWGERFRARLGPRDQAEVLWTSAGLQHFDYNASGVPTATTFADGSRSVIFPLTGQHRRLLVSPLGVAIVELSDTGTVRRMLKDDGTYCIFKYTREGLPTTISTPGETIRIERTSERLVTVVRSDRGYAIRFNRLPNGQRGGFCVTGLREGTGRKLMMLLAATWRVLGPTIAPWQWRNVGLA